MKDCPCHSKKNYSDCCEPLHLGATANNSTELMRSRFSAYSLQLVNYIIETTHESSVHQEQNIAKWKFNILDFCKKTAFNDLKIIEHITFDDSETVTFKAFLFEGDTEISFTEKSLFKSENGRLKYVHGEHI
jgi:SEC-C motif domain protein